MASPFTVFRKHQKAMLAVVCLLAMISFVFLPIIGQTIGSLTGGAQNPVAVSSRYGDLREADFRLLHSQHSIVVNFMTRALEAVGYKADPRWMMSMLQRAGQMLGSLPPEQIQGILNQAWAGEVQRSVQQEFGSPTEQRLAETWLLAQRARQLGIVVSDQAVIEYIRGRTADSLPEDKARQIIDGLGVGQHQLLEAFRNALLAERLKQMFAISLEGTTPAQRWEDFQRLRRQAGVELAALDVADFVAKVPQPDDKTISEFFDRYKTRAADPNSPEPGFREPYRATVEYFKADYDKFFDPKSVTDAEIRKYYDEHKEEFVKQELPKPEEPAAAKPGEKPKAHPTPKIEMPKIEPPKIEPPREKPAAKPAEKAAEKPKDKPKDAPKDKPKDKPKDLGKSSSLWKSARVSLAALEAKPAPKSDAKPAPKPEAKPAVKPEAKAESKPKPEAKPAAKSEAKPVVKPEPKPEAKPAAKVEVKPQYQPLEQVSGQIRDRLAGEKATKKMMALLDPIRDQVRRFSAQLARAIGRKETELPKFDGAAVAKANGLTLHRLEMVSHRDMAGQDIAGSTTNDRQTFEQHVFGVPGLGRPAIAKDLGMNMYLFWKVDENKEHVPKLDDPGVRARVVETWKTVQARSLAMAEAERLAAKARQSKTPLKEVFKGDPKLKVVDPKPFSWFTEGSVPRGMPEQEPLSYSQVEGATGAGAAFMQAVFGLAKGGVGVATNQNKSQVYVVRVDQFSPLTEVLWAIFIHEDYGRYALVALNEQRAVFLSWMDEIKQSAAFQWKREPDQREGSGMPYGPSGPVEMPDF